MSVTKLVQIKVALADTKEPDTKEGYNSSLASRIPQVASMLT